MIELVYKMQRLGAAVSFPNTQKRHRLWIWLIVSAAAIMTATLVFYGWDYYTLDQTQRPYSQLHAHLRPSGRIGLRLGNLALILFMMIYLYPLRKHWPALGRIGKTKNWFDFHVTLGLTAPIVVTFHSSFKFQGFAGMAYWTMLALTASGIIGRYLYAQIPRSIGAAEMSLKEMQNAAAELMEAFKAQKAISVEELERIFRLPDAAKVQSMFILRALAQMVWLDITRPLKIWKLRRCGMVSGGWTRCFRSVVRTANPELERAISLASRQAALSKRILFLSKTHRVFHLWHVIHRPFSLSFALFVIIHVVVVMYLGYF